MGGKTVRCETTNKDRYGRWIAECFRQDESISRWLVREGWALDWARYSNGKFSVEQKHTEAEQRGECPEFRGGAIDKAQGAGLFLYRPRNSFFSILPTGLRGTASTNFNFSGSL
ncbi:thermonuclease family protein [Algiphilus sp.]|uniref:thermonuclease family protein n=1 Tax=Algiphilus sp. TaxID=1872431 RepID=UPI0032EEC132